METRPQFILGDLAANILVATAAVACSTWLIGGELGMLPGMLVGMLLGMAIALILSMGLLAPLLGIMEVMSPCMLGGMLGGMCGGMWALTGSEILFSGSATGTSVITAVYLLNAILSGPQKVSE
jgi:hypothetical protein